MKIITSRNPPGTYDGVPDTLDNSVDPVMAFYGNCMGVAIVYRGENDFHYVCIILTHDDGHWTPSRGRLSSHWLPELIEVLTEAKRWLNKNAKRNKYGWNK